MSDANINPLLLIIGVRGEKSYEQYIQGQIAESVKETV
jgi:hypothetical protein